MSEFGDRANVLKLYFGGDLEAALALSGQVAGRIDAVRPVADVIRETAADCLALLEQPRGALSALGKRLVQASAREPQASG